MKRIAAFILLSVSTWTQADTPQLRVQAQVLGAEQAVVGQTVQLQLDVLTDTWFTQAPHLPTLSIPGALVTPPGDQAQHLTLSENARTWFGMRYLYQISARQAGTLAIPALTVQAQPGNAPTPLSASSQPLHFSVHVPAGVTPGHPLLVASSVSLTQQVAPPPTSLKAGDSLTRSVTLEAPGALGLALPVTPLGEVPGLSRYLQTPQVLSLDDGRGQALGARRIDSARYRIEQPGHYQLPAMQVQWWSTTDRQLHTATLPAVTFSAAANPAYTPAFSVRDDLQRLGQHGRLHLPHAVFGVAVLGVLAGLLGWAARRFGPSLLARWQHAQDARRQRRLASAEYAWRQVPAELAQRPPQLTALYRWWWRSQGSVRLANATTQAVLRRLYGPHAAPADTPARLGPELVQVHAQVSRRNAEAPSRHGLRPLNPQRNRESR